MLAVLDSWWEGTEGDAESPASLGYLRGQIE
jgi:natural product precursor